MTIDKDMITITKDGLKTFCQGALGAMTFGAYHMYVSTEMIKMNNRYFYKQMEEQHREIEEQHREIEEQHREIEELRQNIHELQRRRWWF